MQFAVMSYNTKLVFLNLQTFKKHN